MPDEVVIFQVRDNDLVRRDLGIQTTTPGEWALRTKTPDSDDLLTDIKDRLDDVVTNTVSPLSPVEYDFIDLGYTGSDLTSVVYKTGGSGGTVVRTVTLTYSAGNLDTIAVA